METRVDRGWCSRWGHPSRDPSIEISIMQIDSSRSDRCCLVTGNATNHHDCAHWCMISVLPTSYVRRIVIPPLLIVVSRCFVRTRGSWCRKNVSWDFVSLAKDRENLASFMSLSSIVKSFGRTRRSLWIRFLPKIPFLAEFYYCGESNLQLSLPLTLYQVYFCIYILIMRVWWSQEWCLVLFLSIITKEKRLIKLWYEKREKEMDRVTRNCVDNSIE